MDEGQNSATRYRMLQHIALNVQVKPMVMDSLLMVCTLCIGLFVRVRSCIHHVYVGVKRTIFTVQLGGVCVCVWVNVCLLCCFILYFVLLFGVFLWGGGFVLVVLRAPTDQINKWVVLN